MTGTTETHAPPGRAPSGLIATYHLEQERTASPGLPDGVWRDQFVDLIIQAYRADLRPADQAVLRFYAQHTRPRDWSEPGPGPVCYMAQLNTAERLCLDRKSVYNAERRLTALGLIEKTALANGHRRGPRGTRVETAPLGIRFAPAIADYEAIAVRVEEIRRAQEALTAWRYHVSALHTRLRIALRDAPVCDAMVEAIAENFAAQPTRIARIEDVDQLIRLEEIFQGLIDDLGEHIDTWRREHNPVENRPESPPLPHDIPHKPGTRSSHHIYTTTNSSSVNCTSSEEKRTGANAPDTHNPEPANAGTCLEDKAGVGGRRVNASDSACGRQAEPVNWRIGQLLAAAGEDFRFCLAGVQPNAAAVRSEDLVDAAASLAGALGINQSAWADACRVMGRFDAALAVLVIDRNRSHPACPVYSPGGALRGMTVKARKGELNLDASVFAILRRTADSEVLH